MSTKNNGNGSQGEATKHAQTAIKETVKLELSTFSIGPKDEKKEEPEILKAVKVEEKPKHLEAPEVLKICTVEERKQKALLFETLLNKHEQITEAKNKLDKFVVAGSNADVGQGIRLTDNKNNVFSTSNFTVLNDCIKLIQKHTQEQFLAIEKEVLNFKI